MSDSNSDFSKMSDTDLSKIFDTDSRLQHPNITLMKFGFQRFVATSNQWSRGTQQEFSVSIKVSREIAPFQQARVRTPKLKCDDFPLEFRSQSRIKKSDSDS